MSDLSKGINIPKNILPIHMGDFMNILGVLYLVGMLVGMVYTLGVQTIIEMPFFSEYVNIIEVMPVVYWTIFGMSVLYYVGSPLYHNLNKTNCPRLFPFNFFTEHELRNEHGYILYIWKKDDVMQHVIYHSTYTTDIQSVASGLKYGTPFITIELRSNKVTIGTTKGAPKVEEVELSNGVISPWFTSFGSTLSGFKIATNNFALTPSGAFYGVDQGSIVEIDHLLTFIEQATQTEGCVVSTLEGKNTIRFDLSVASLLTELEASENKLSWAQTRCDELESVETDRLRAITAIGKIVEDLHDRDFIGKSPKARVLKLAIWDTWGKIIQTGLPAKPMYAVLDEQLDRSLSAK